MAWVQFTINVAIGFMVGHEYGIGAGMFSGLTLLYLGSISDQLIEVNERHGCSTSKSYNYDFKP